MIEPIPQRVLNLPLPADTGHATVRDYLAGCLANVWEYGDTQRWEHVLLPALVGAGLMVEGDEDAADGLVADAITALGEKPAHTPARGDAVEVWLKAQRDGYDEFYPEREALDNALDLYRLHADAGVPLGQHVCAGPNCDHDGEEP